MADEEDKELAAALRQEMGDVDAGAAPAGDQKKNILNEKAQEEDLKETTDNKHFERLDGTLQTELIFQRKCALQPRQVDSFDMIPPSLSLSLPCTFFTPFDPSYSYYYL